MTVDAPSPVPVPPKLSKKEPAHRMYLPAVYRYTCQGAFSASSLEHGSTGNCKGVRSRMEHLLDMNPSTRSEAITSFTGDAVDVAGDDDVGLIEDGRPNPALIYPRLPFPLNQQTDKSKIDEEDGIDDTKVLRETWKAFGSTEVECLQLTDLKTGRTEIVAVSPYNAAIVSTRRIEMKDRTISSTELGIGPYKMQFLIESGVVRDELETTQTQIADQVKKRTDKKTVPQETSGKDVPIIPQINMENVEHILSSSGAFLEKMQDFSGKIVSRMHTNAEWLYGNLSDDFPARTVASGKRIVDQMPKTAALFVKVFRQVLGSDDEGRRDDR